MLFGQVQWPTSWFEIAIYAWFWSRAETRSVGSICVSRCVADATCCLQLWIADGVTASNFSSGFLCLKPDHGCWSHVRWRMCYRVGYLVHCFSTFSTWMTNTVRMSADAKMLLISWKRILNSVFLFTQAIAFLWNMVRRTTKQWPTLRSYLNSSVNTTVDKCIKSYRKPPRNLLSSVCFSVVTSSWKHKTCNCKANMYCKTAQWCADFTCPLIARSRTWKEVRITLLFSWNSLLASFYTPSSNKLSFYFLCRPSPR